MLQRLTLGQRRNRQPEAEWLPPASCREKASDFEK